MGKNVRGLGDTGGMPKLATFSMPGMLGKMTTPLSFKVGELFSGPGGMAKGAQLAAESLEGIELVHAWANDMDEWACETYLRNIKGATKTSVHCGDVKDFDSAGAGEIDGLAFGFPCNDFSLVGKSKGLDGAFGPLYKHGVRALAAHNPMWFVAENVGGLRSANEGSAFLRIMDDLSKAGLHGYRLYPHLYQFDLYGVPQRRKRIIIVGIRADLDFVYKVPSPRLYSDVNVSAKHAIETPKIDENAFNNELTKQGATVVERLKRIRPGENAFTADLPDQLKLNIRGATISQIYKRLHPDEPSYTITGSGGGGTHVYHWREPRALTNRERARLQSFPDDYIFYGSKEAVRKQIGMAVPVKGAQAIFSALFKTFLGISYESIEQNIEFAQNPMLS